jgi:hypothetical protein
VAERASTQGRTGLNKKESVEEEEGKARKGLQSWQGRDTEKDETERKMHEVNT